MDVSPQKSGSQKSPALPSLDREALSFEDAVAQLESIVKRLESEGTSLDDSLRLFEEGVRLSRHCSSKLDEAEKKVLLLVEDREGNLSTTPFEGPENAE